MKEEIEKYISDVVRELYAQEVKPEVSRPDPKFGEYSTNVALSLASKLSKSPSEVASEIVEKLKTKNIEPIQDISIAGSGFINFLLTDSALLKVTKDGPKKAFEGQEIVVEFGNANPFKEMHLGHLYMTIVGDTIAKLFERSGAKVERVSYHGDVGLHVAKAIWAIKKYLSAHPETDVEELLGSGQKIGQFYAEGSQTYEDNETSREEIKKINELVYSKQDAQINEIYDKGSQLSFASFDKVFQVFNIHFNKRYLESQTSEIGLKTVRENIGKVFKESDGAVVFDGESKGLHTRVFINSQGLPTYEAKDLGLAELKNQDFPNASKSIIITDTQQLEYFRVMLAALKEIDSALAQKTIHLTHGHLGLSSGKMSSRSGEVYSAERFSEDIKQAVEKNFPDSSVKDQVYMGALRYTLLKHKLGSDILIDVGESVALEGNSGPYLQYSHARAMSIIQRAGAGNADAQFDLDDEERKLASKLSEYPDVVGTAVDQLMPHIICTYLYELAQVFNHFYEKCRVVGDERQTVRLSLVSLYGDTLKDGLNMVGISAPDKM
ncbi:MAG TPA: arginine--tRNA ligase [Candidatus Sulfotelmatobacter sp.]|nr:arginine--tRNA ligase [Candidatus Sulfotelmatobacter sp.]